MIDVSGLDHHYWWKKSQKHYKLTALNIEKIWRGKVLIFKQSKRLKPP